MCAASKTGPKSPRAQAERSQRLFRVHGHAGQQIVPKPPQRDISLGTPKPALPKYLTREESLSLLKNIQSDFYERDFCIITLFLNCGMRLSELVGIDLSDFRDDTIRILGQRAAKNGWSI